MLSTSQSDEHEQAVDDADENRLLNEAYGDFGNEANELEAKLDLVTSPSPTATSGQQLPPSFPDTKVEPTSPTSEAPSQQATDPIQSNDDAKTPSTTEEHENVQQATSSATSPKLDSTLPIRSPPKVSAAVSPTTATAATTKKSAGAASTTRSSLATKTKPSSAGATTTKSTEHKPATASSKTAEHKPAAAATSKTLEHKTAASTTKMTEPKAPTTVRKPPQSAPTSSAAASHKPKVTPASPAHELSTAPKPIVSI